MSEPQATDKKGPKRDPLKPFFGVLGCAVVEVLRYHPTLFQLSRWLLSLIQPYRSLLLFWHVFRNMLPSQLSQVSTSACFKRGYLPVLLLSVLYF